MSGVELTDNFSGLLNISVKISFADGNKYGIEEAKVVKNNLEKKIL